MSIEMIKMILEDGFRVRHLQDLEGNPVFSGVRLKEIGLHP